MPRAANVHYAKRRGRVAAWQRDRVYGDQAYRARQRVLSFAKLRYRGLAKNTQRLWLTCGLTNLLLSCIGCCAPDRSTMSGARQFSLKWHNGATLPFHNIIHPRSR